MDFAAGAIIAHRYRVDRKVAAGGMGEVWEGVHVAVGSRVALKRLLPASMGSPELVRRFRREAHLLGRIRSEHVVRALDFVRDEEHGPVLVMEYVDGELLSEVMHSSVLSCAEAVTLGVELVSALGDLHAAHVVHRDLKPANVILQRTDSGRRRAILVDLGISRVFDTSVEGEQDGDTEITRADIALGTLEYMAPEQIVSCRQAGRAADLYAVGAILFRAVTGRHVFDPLRGMDLARRKLVADPKPAPLSDDPLADGLAAVLTRALRRAPEDRYPSAAAMLADLLAVRELAGSSESANGSALLAHPAPQRPSSVSAFPSRLTGSPALSSPIDTPGRFRVSSKRLALGALAVFVAATALVGSHRETVTPALCLSDTALSPVQQTDPPALPASSNGLQPTTCIASDAEGACGESFAAAALVPSPAGGAHKGCEAPIAAASSARAVPVAPGADAPPSTPVRGAAAESLIDVPGRP